MSSTWSEQTGLELTRTSRHQVEWLLDNVPGARARPRPASWRSATVDTWLTPAHARAGAHTDVTKRSRTLLFNIHSLAWDADLLDCSPYPLSVLPVVVAQFQRDRSHREGPLAGVPLAAFSGDHRQLRSGRLGSLPAKPRNFTAPAVPGAHTGTVPVASEKGCLLPSAGSWGRGVPPEYALEGSIFRPGP